DFDVLYDEAGSIGKRYRRMDAIGTPMCITIDDTTAENGTVTVRDRDSMSHEVVKFEDLRDYISKAVQF
ncbi:MAG: glycine--tRNA ligase, partial [Erysipelotrichaceae bacterium]|nr:glycine--tRNA ligase [Erysipelotrichaceae bacterium]